MPHKKTKRGRASPKSPVASSAPNTEMVIGMQNNLLTQYHQREN